MDLKLIGVVSYETDVLSSYTQIDAGQVCKQIQQFIDDPNDTTLNIYIDSFGGYLNAALQIRDLMVKARSTNGKTVNCYVDSYAASCAALLAVSGSKLYLGTYGSLMIHSAYHSTEDLTQIFPELDESTLSLLLSDIQSANETIAQILSNESTTDFDTFRNQLKQADSEVFLYLEELQNFGFKVESGEFPVSSEVLSAVNLDTNFKKLTKKEKLDFFLTTTLPEESLKIYNLKKNKVNFNQELNKTMQDKDQKTSDTVNAETIKAEVLNQTQHEVESLVDQKVNEKLQAVQAKNQADLEAAQQRKADILEVFKDHLHKPEYLNLCNGLINSPADLNTVKNALSTRICEDQRIEKVTANITGNPQTKSILNALTYRSLKGMPNEEDVSTLAVLNNRSQLDLIKDLATAEGIPFANQNPRNFRELVLSFDTADYSKVTDLLTTYIWSNLPTYQDFSKILDITDVVKVDDYNTNQLWYCDSAIPDFKETPEGGAVDVSQMSTKYTTFTIKDFTIGFKITERALLNDRIDVFYKTIKKIAVGAQYTLNKEILNLLKVNKDSFHKLDVTTIDASTLLAIEEYYANFSNDKNEPILVRPDFVITGVRPAYNFNRYIESAFDPDAPNDIVNNPFKGSFEVIKQPLLKNILGDANKNDIFIVPKGNIVLVAGPNGLTPQIETTQATYTKDFETIARCSFGLKILDPKQIIYIDGSKLKLTGPAA